MPISLIMTAMAVDPPWCGLVSAEVDEHIDLHIMVRGMMTGVYDVQG